MFAYNIKIKTLYILIFIIYTISVLGQKEITYSEIPENERPESLILGKDEKNVDSIHAAKRAELENPMLKECYKSTSLFFSPLTTVCSSKCLEQTVAASKIIAPFADKFKSVQISKDFVFSSWSILENAKIFCGKDGNSFCIRKIKDFELIILQKQKGKEPTEQTKQRLCKPCIKDIYKLLKEHLINNTIIPTVYYDQIKNIENIVPEIEKLCNFS